MSALTAQDLWDALYAWAHGVLPDVEITQSHEDAPSPSGNYVCIDYAGTWRMAGTSASRMLSDDTSRPSPRVYMYRGSVQVRDVEGDGENLMLLLESLENPDVQAAFGAAGISVLRSSGPVMMPALQESTWRRESLLTLEMSWARAYAGSELTIESVTVQKVDGSGTVEEEIEIDTGWEPEPAPTPDQETEAQET